MVKSIDWFLVMETKSKQDISEIKFPYWWWKKWIYCLFFVCFKFIRQKVDTLKSNILFHIIFFDKIVSLHIWQNKGKWMGN